MGGLSSGIILIEGHSTKYMTSALLLTVKVVKTKKNLSLLNSKKIKPVKSKGNQPWISIVRTDADAEAPILWPPDTKSQLIGKDPDAGKDWREEENRMTEDEIVG